MSPDEVVAKDIAFDWTAGEACFSCPCGEREIILSESGDTKECACGRTYTLHHYVTVREARMAPTA